MKTLTLSLICILFSLISFSQCEFLDQFNIPITNDNFPLNTNLLVNSDFENYQFGSGFDCWTNLGSPDLGIIGVGVSGLSAASCDVIMDSYNENTNNEYFACFGTVELLQMNFPFILKKGKYRFTYHYTTCEESDALGLSLNIGYSDYALDLIEGLDIYIYNEQVDGVYSIEEPLAPIVGGEWLEHVLEFDLCQENINHFHMTFTGNGYRHVDGVRLELIEEFPGLVAEAIDETCSGSEDGSIDLTYFNSVSYS